MLPPDADAPQPEPIDPDPTPAGPGETPDATEPAPAPTDDAPGELVPAPADDAPGELVLEPSPASPLPLLGPWQRPRVSWLIALTVLALVTRLVWVLFVHPPGNYVYSDMGGYVARARAVVAEGIEPAGRTHAFWPWGAHMLLAVPLRLFGPDNLVAGAVLWALFSAGAVPLAYFLAARVSRVRAVPEVVGTAALLWHPNLSGAGYFLSEVPFLFWALLSTLCLVDVLQRGRRALLAGVASAVAFAVRPQAAIFFALTLVTWLLVRRRARAVRWFHVLLVAAPLVAIGVYSVQRFERYTGYGPGVAENAGLNLTFGRCHCSRIHAYSTPELKEAADRGEKVPRNGGFGLPNYGAALGVPKDHLLRLRPVLGETVNIVGYIGDPETHKALQRECVARTGWVTQSRMMFVNLMLAWFVDKHWPESGRGAKRYYWPLRITQGIFQWLVLVPSLIGVGLAVVRARTNPGAALCAWQLVSAMVVAAVFFGAVRLRTPYDPYALLLAAETWGLAAVWAWRRWRARRAVPSTETVAEVTG